MKKKNLFLTIAAILLGQLSMSQTINLKETVTDVDGNVYPTSKIGTQVWTSQNLRTTRYNDGTPIPRIDDYNQWGAMQSPGRCFFGNDTINKDSYGVFYNWYAVNTGKLAPKGWRVPTEADWEKLTDCVMESMKQNYINPSVKPILFVRDMGMSGHRSDVSYHQDKNFNYWWINSAVNTDTAKLALLYLENGVVRSSTRSKSYGFAVRLIKEDEGYSNICEAIFKYDTTAVRKLVNAGVDLNKAYTYPSYNGKLETRYPFDLLYNLKEERYKDIYGMLLLFINNGLNLNPSHNGKFPVICYVVLAAFSKEQTLSLLHALLDNKADINAVNGYNDNAIFCICTAPPLRRARSCSEVCEIAKFLLEHGADPTIKDNLYQKNALEKAKKDFDCKELNTLLKSYSKK